MVKNIYLLAIWLLFGCRGDKIERQTTYHQNGKVATVYQMKDGKLHGRYESKYENGKTKIIGNYVNDEHEGIFAFFREDGTIQEIDEYKNDSILNVAEFDERGFCYKSTHQLQYDSDKGKTKKGEAYNLTLGFQKEPIGEVEVLIEEQDSKSNNKDDVIAALKPDSGYVVTYSVGPQKDFVKGVVIDRVQISLDSFDLDLKIPFEFKIETVSNE